MRVALILGSMLLAGSALAQPYYPGYGAPPPPPGFGGPPGYRPPPPDYGYPPPRYGRRPIYLCRVESPFGGRSRTCPTGVGDEGDLCRCAGNPIPGQVEIR